MKGKTALKINNQHRLLHGEETIDGIRIRFRQLGEVFSELDIGVDGLDPCFVNATQGAPNILQRLPPKGSFTLDGARNVMPVFSGPNWSAHLAGLNVEESGNYK